MKHTQGPWKVSIDGITVIHDCGKLGLLPLFLQPLETRIFEKPRLPISEMQANAHLIAAAPEMLEALEQALRLIAVAEINNAFKDCALPLIGMKTISSMEALIKKAKGE